MKSCPCGSQKQYEQCCGPFLDGRAIAPTAEALMRSRYTAYTKNAVLGSLHVSQISGDFELSTAKPLSIASTSSESLFVRYLRLKNILNILTVCFRVFFGACLAESTLTYPQPFPASRDDLCEICGLVACEICGLEQVPKLFRH